MRLIKRDSLYICQSQYHEREVPKRAGFRWDPTQREWWTDDVVRAARLLNYAEDPALRAELLGVIRRRERDLNLSRAVDAPIDVPAPDGLAYMPFQRAAIAFALDREATLFADEMGLGKTVEAIGVINADETIEKVLVVCPATLRLNWRRELGRWLTRRFMVGIADSKHFPARPDWPERPIVVINYDILHRHEKRIRSIAWDLLIGDEIHLCKNRKTRRTQQMLGRRSQGEDAGLEPIQARRRLFLTGTPIVNRPIELWPIVHALDPRAFHSWWDYQRRYCNGTMTRWGLDVGGASRLEELQDLLRSSVMVRRLKKDVLTELPAKRRQVIELAANGAEDCIERERDAVDRQEDTLAALRAAVELAKASESEEEYREAVRALRSGAAVSFEEISRLRHETALAKLPYLLEHVRQLLCDEGIEKLVVFAHHKDVIAEIARFMPQQTVSLTGDTSLENRQRAIDQFQHAPEIRLFVGSIQAAGLGITLTAASHVVFAELDWVPGNMTQAEDRVHRIGQNDAVLIQHLVLEGSIDATMAETLIQKQEVIERALDSRDREGGEDYLVPLRESPATQSASRRQIAEEAAWMSPVQSAAIHQALRMLAGVCDGALARDGTGFSKMDAMIGHALARAPGLTARQGALGLRLCRRYRGQLPEGMLAVALGPARDVSRETAGESTPSQ